MNDVPAHGRTSRGSVVNTSITESIISARRPVAEHLPLPKAVTKEIEARLIEKRAVMRLDQLREEIRRKRSRKGVPGTGIVLGVLIGLGLWTVIVLALWR